MDHATIVSISDASCIGEARRAAARRSIDAQLDEVFQGRVAVVATELATNLLNHAQGGQLMLQVVETPIGRAVELLAIDLGPGIANIDKAMQDGFSTAGTPGNGLGAVRRLSTEFDVYSQRPGGTVMMSRVGGQSSSPAPPSIPSFPSIQSSILPSGRQESQLTWAGISICAPGEDVCGDGWSVFQADDRLSIMVADGLGHGPMAAEASGKACAVFDAKPLEPAGVVLQQAHRALAGTRGAAIAVAHFDFAAGLMKYAGTGNIAGTLLTETDHRGLFTHHGIVGVQLRKVQEFEYSIESSGSVVMHSDGLQSRWDISQYPGLMTRHPAVVCGVLCRDFVRGRDDVTVVVARWNSFKRKMS